MYLTCAFIFHFQGKTQVKKNNYCPVWNEKITFIEKFPPPEERIDIQIKDYDTVADTVIGTHTMDLNSVCNKGEKGEVH